MKDYIREPINSITHLIGIFLSAIGLILLLIISYTSGSFIKVLSSIIFGLGLIGLYTASTVYHWSHFKEKTLELLRKIDHIMIYFLIAATYTPICLISLKGLTGYILLGSVWTLAISGMLIKIFWFDLPRWLYTGFYLLLGWAIIFAIFPLSRQLAIQGLLLIALGGVSYTVGAVIYGFKPSKLRLWKFGFHEIFHVFILLGSFLHYLGIYKYVMR